jgi:hypothetical protein
MTLPPLSQVIKGPLAYSVPWLLNTTIGASKRGSLKTWGGLWGAPGSGYGAEGRARWLEGGRTGLPWCERICRMTCRRNTDDIWAQ